MSEFVLKIDASELTKTLEDFLTKISALINEKPVTHITLGQPAPPEPVKLELVELPDLEAVLAGDHQGLHEAFLWDATPQGQDYWEVRARGKVPLSEADIDWIRRSAALTGITGIDVTPAQPTPEPEVFEPNADAILNIDEALKVVAGDSNALLNAVVWQRTPQGQDYWCDRCGRDDLLSQADKDWITRSVLEKQATEPVEHPPVVLTDLSPTPLNHVLNGGEPMGLAAAFIWDLTPQGGTYWSNRASCEVPLSGADFSWLKASRDLTLAQQGSA